MGEKATFNGNGTVAAAPSGSPPAKRNMPVQSQAPGRPWRGGLGRLLHVRLPQEEAGPEGAWEAAARREGHVDEKALHRWFLRHPQLYPVPWLL